MEVWANEVLVRNRQRTAVVPDTIESSSLDARKERASAFVQDFVSSLSKFGMSDIIHL